MLINGVMKHDTIGSLQHDYVIATKLTKNINKIIYHNICFNMHTLIGIYLLKIAIFKNIITLFNTAAALELTPWAFQTG